MGERADQRIDAAVGVVVRFGGTSEPCLSRTLSTGGISLGTSRRWPPGTIVDLEIVHEGSHIRLAARVVSESPGGVGFEFVERTPDHERALAALIQRLVPTSDTSRDVPPDALSTVQWSVPGEEKRGWFHASTHRAKLIDLSLDGAAVTDKSPPEVGRTIVLELQNPGHRSGEADRVQCEARVVRHTEHGFAVQFVAPSALFRSAVSKLRRAARARG